MTDYARDERLRAMLELKPRAGERVGRFVAKYNAIVEASVPKDEPGASLDQVEVCTMASDLRVPGLTWAVPLKVWNQHHVGMPTIHGWPGWIDLPVADRLFAEARDLCLPLALMPGSAWRHHKGGMYDLLDFGISAVGHRLVVAYRSREKKFAWIRTVEDFASSVGRRPGGAAIPRFSLVVEPPTADTVQVVVPATNPS